MYKSGAIDTLLKRVSEKVAAQERAEEHRKYWEEQKEYLSRLIGGLNCEPPISLRKGMKTKFYAAVAGLLPEDYLDYGRGVITGRTGRPASE